MLIRRAEIEGEVRDVRIADGRIEAIAEHLAPHAGEAAIDAAGAPCCPGCTTTTSISSPWPLRSSP